MKEIQFNKKKYQIPTDWNEVTLGMQIEVSQIASEQQYVKTLGIIAGYTGIPVDELKAAKFNQLTHVMKSLEFISTPMPDKPILEFEYKGNKYMVANNMLEQEFQDYVAIQTAIAENKDNIWKVTPMILAVMCKRGNESLDDFDILERSKEFMDLPLPIANGISSFFLSNTKVLKSIMMYSSPEARNDIVQSKMQELNTSLNKLKEQHGGNSLTRWWITTQQRYINYLNRPLEKYFNSQASNNSKMKWKVIYKKLLSKMQKTKMVKDS